MTLYEYFIGFDNLPEGRWEKYDSEREEMCEKMNR